MGSSRNYHAIWPKVQAVARGMPFPDPFADSQSIYITPLSSCKQVLAALRLCNTVRYKLLRAICCCAEYWTPRTLSSTGATLHCTDPPHTRCYDVSDLELPRFQMSVIFRLAYGRRVRTLQDDIVVESTKAGGSTFRFTVCGRRHSLTTYAPSVFGKYVSLNTSVTAHYA